MQDGFLATDSLSKLILFGECSLQRALTEFVEHCHSERNHQGKGNSLLFPPRSWKRAAEMFVAPSVSAACFDIIPASLEYFGHTAQDI